MQDLEQALEDYSKKKADLSEKQVIYRQLEKQMGVLGQQISGLEKGLEESRQYCGEVILPGLKQAAQDLDERSLSGCPELTETEKEFIKLYEEATSEGTRQALQEGYEQAKDKTKEVSAYVAVWGDSVYLSANFDTVATTVEEGNLAQDLVFYVFEALGKVGLKLPHQEKEGLAEIPLKKEEEKEKIPELVNILKASQPEGFEKAGVEFKVIYDREFFGEPEETERPEKIKAVPEEKAAPEKPSPLERAAASPPKARAEDRLLTYSEGAEIWRKRAENELGESLTFDNCYAQLYQNAKKGTLKMVVTEDGRKGCYQSELKRYLVNDFARRRLKSWEGDTISFEELAEILGTTIDNIVLKIKAKKLKLDKKNNDIKISSARSFLRTHTFRGKIWRPNVYKRK